jgi:DNA-binding LytR/AlgR family response regulator
MSAAESGSALQWTQHRKGIVISAVAALLMAFVGAFGTDQIGFGPRLGYWLIVMLSGALIGIGVTAAVHAWGRLRSHIVAEGAVIALAISLPLTFVVFAASAMFFGMAPPSPTTFIALAGAVFTISASMTAVNYAVSHRGGADAGAVASQFQDDATGAAQPSVAAAVPADTPDRFVERLPLPHRNAQLIALQAEDHYLRVHTDAGSTLILMRLSDAVSEIGDGVGIQTHRSWWVARDAIKAIARAEGRAELTLVNDVSVPVSRAHYRSLRQHPWFATL